MSGVPTAPLQRLSWIGVGVTLVIGIGLAVLVALAGTDFLDENTTARGIFWLLMIIGFGAWGASWYLIKRRSGGGTIEEVFEYRDDRPAVS